MAKKLKKEIKEWVILIGVLIILIYTPIGKTISSTIQRGFLATGLIQPTLNDENSESIKANYNFSLTNHKGQPLRFTEYQGKTIFLNFWATWCGPCIAEMPDINELYQEYENNDQVKFVMISVDKDFEKAKSFIADKSYEFPIHQLTTGLPEVYQATSIPTTYVISPNGNIVVERHGIAKYNTDKFKNFLNNLEKKETEFTD